MSSLRKPIAAFHGGPARRGLNRRQSCWRLLWLVVMLLHAPLTVGAFSALFRGDDGVRWSSLLLLALSNAFFVFEIVFAYSLRIISDRRKLIAFLIVVALLHVGLLERGMPHYFHELLPQQWVLFAAASTLAVRFIIEVLGALGRRLSASAASVSRRGPPRNRLFDLALPLARLRSMIFGPLQVPVRAPPAANL